MIELAVSVLTYVVASTPPSLSLLVQVTANFNPANVPELNPGCMLPENPMISILGVKLAAAGAEELAGRARGTPRIANRLLKRVRDYAEVKADGTIDGKIAREALDAFEVDQKGFDQMDRKLLLTLIEKFNGI